MANIQWYPGHMAKAKRELKERLPLVDVVFELVDARIPEASRNPSIVELTHGKPSVVILMKADLADPRVTQQWISEYHKQGIEAVTFNAKSGRSGSVDQIVHAARSVLEDKFAKREEKGLKERAIRAVTVGIPNVGKSTLINRFAGKKVTQTGDRPGVTKAQQWIKYKDKIELLDMPGILWPKFEDQLVGQKLALTGAIKDTLFHMDDIALYAISYIRKYYPGALTERYNLDESMEAELTDVDILLVITKKRGYFDDYERGSEMLLNEIRDGKLGLMSFEQPEEAVTDEIND